MYFKRMRTIVALCFILNILPVCAQDKNATVWMEDLTWVELKAQIDTGYTTVILPTGGLEQNGPFISLGKHNHVVAHAAQEVATQLGHTLVAPVFKVVPQGAMDAPSGNLLFPGTMAVREETFDAVLQDMVLSLAYAGFKCVYLLGDHGQSQAVQAQVAQRMTQRLQAVGVRVVQVHSYYQPTLEADYLTRQGIAPETQGEHAGVSDTAQIWAVHEEAIRKKALLAHKADQQRDTTVSGMSGQPELATPELGRMLLALRIQAALAEIRKSEGLAK